MDQLIQYMNMSHKQVDDYEGNFIDDVSRHVDIFVWFWNYLRLSLVAPKFHLVKDHLTTEFFERWHAIGPFNEEFTESDHVKGNAETRTFGGMRDPQRREESVSKRTAVMENPNVQAIMERVSPNKGKRKRLTDETRGAIKTRRVDALDEVRFLKETCANSGKMQISDYWNQTTDER
jgi:hypothetical protein